MEYTKSEIANILKKNKRTIQYWTDFGLVEPDISPSMGKGKARLYSDKNLVQFAMVEYLGQLGVELNTMKDVMDGLRKGYEEIDHGEPVGHINENGEVVKERIWRTDFSDFFENREWGNIKELVFFESRTRLKTSSEIPEKHPLFYDFKMFDVIFKHDDSFWGYGREEKDLIQNYIWLGQIKIEAVKDLLGEMVPQKKTGF